MSAVIPATNTYRLELIDDSGQVVQSGEYVSADTSGYTIRQEASRLLKGVTVRAYAVIDGHDKLIRELSVEGIRSSNG